MATETGGAAAGGEQQYSLRWNDFHSAMVSSFRRLRDEEDFVDVTLACAGATFTAHKVVLSACSPYFRRLLKANPCQHPIVILRDVHDKDMESLLRFMYQGEVHIGQEQLKEFLRAAQLLQVRGLTDVPAPAPVPTLDQKASPCASSWPETGSGGSREGRDSQQREGRRSRRPDEGANNTPPPKRARSSDLYQAQMKSRSEQLLAVQGGSPDRLGSNGHEFSQFSQALDVAQNLTGGSNNLSGDGEESSSDAGASDTEGEPRAKQEPLDFDDPTTMASTNGALPHNFPGLLNLQGFPGLPGPSGMPDSYGATWPAGGETKPCAKPEERYQPYGAPAYGNDAAARDALAKPAGRDNVEDDGEVRGREWLDFLERGGGGGVVGCGVRGVGGDAGVAAGTGELQCPLCAAVLGSLALARRHLDAHYPRDSPVCPVASCARYFAHPNSVRNHMRIKHRRQWERMKTLKWSCGWAN